MTNNTESKDSNKVALQAIQRIKDEGLSAQPEIYKLFFIYYSGKNAELTHSIDILVAQNFELTEERCMELYRRHLDTDLNRDTLYKAEKIVGDTLNGVDQIMDNFKISNKNFFGSMETINASVLDTMDVKEYKKLLASIIQEAQKMVNENQILERRLQKSSATMQELQREMEAIKTEAYTDTLTGIANRKKFDLEVVRLVAEARDENTPISLIFIDIDHFKSFNDTYGHQIGDQVLRLVARAFRDSLKGQDFFCRYGGEEFVIILPKTPLKGAAHIADILRQSIKNKDIKNKNTNETLSSVTISSGVAQLNDEEKIDKWIARADESLYRAKKQGRNCVVVSE